MILINWIIIKTFEMEQMFIMQKNGAYSPEIGS